MTNFRRDKNGNLYATKQGKVIGQVMSMGDFITKRGDDHGSRDKKRKNRK